MAFIVVVCAVAATITGAATIVATPLHTKHVCGNPAKAGTCGGRGVVSPALQAACWFFAFVALAGPGDGDPESTRGNAPPSDRK